MRADADGIAGLELDHILLFRWFVGLTSDDTGWHLTTVTRNRRRLLYEELRR